MKKTTRIMLATTLALAVLGGLTWVLAWRLPATAEAAASTESAVAVPLAPLALPKPYLNHPDVVDAPYRDPLNSWPPPIIDGHISPGEYAGAGRVIFPGYGGYYHEVEVFFKQDGSNLYVAFDLPDKTNTAPDASLFLDTNNDGGSDPQSDDFQFTIARDGSVWEYQGDGSAWTQNFTLTWTYGLAETMTGWSVEFCIPFAKLGINAGTFKVMGLALGNWAAGPPHFWPASAISNQPDTWGSLVSSSDWSTFYWKPGPWEDYAPSGMPDFDQNQQGFMAYDGPAAAANSLWWFDSKFEALTGTAPPIISDTYRLITSYNSLQWDDHHYSNTVPLINDLANNYFGTNQGPFPGTKPISMFLGIQSYLKAHALWDDYIATMVISPSFRWVADEVMHSEDVILLLGLYEWKDPDGNPGSGDEFWARVGGHYVNVAGVDLANGQIAFSDPLFDYAGQGWRPGRVLSGTLIPHQPIPGHSPSVHNDAGNVSHDIYTVTATTSPGGVWGPEMYGYFWDPTLGWIMDEPIRLVLGTNPLTDTDMFPYEGGLLQTEVEIAISVSPYTWKSSGEWIPKEDDDPVNGVWQPWLDYAINGVPDFDQRQDNWGQVGPMGWQWTFCGPVAAANSLWWFDSKFEPSPVGPLMPPYNPMPSNDNYPMVQSYDGRGIIPPWDDHDPLNVDDPTTPWPGAGVLPVPIPLGAGELVEDLAGYFMTDFPPPLAKGTVITNMYKGIDQYLIDHTLREGYVITQVKSPDFWWVAEEVEHSEDVILLLGFWQNQGSIEEPEWVRLGGHYVTVPGVDKQNGFVAFSDPWFDRIGQTWPFAGIGSVPGWPSYMGRVANGWLMPHKHPPVPPDPTHNDAGNVSHDVYNVVGTDSPGGVWGPEEYIDLWLGGIEQFHGQNQEGDALDPLFGVPVQAEVDWAVAVSPVANMWVDKGFDPATATPGETVTITIRFRNDGSLPAEDVAITDTLPSELVNPSWTYWTSNSLTVTRRTGTTYAWDLPDLKWMEWGIITIVAQIDPSLDWPPEKTITNTVEIDTSSIEQYQQPYVTPNAFTTTLTVQTADVEIAKSATPSSLLPGDPVTYTLTYTNHGPATAASTSITDSLPSQLTGATYTYTNDYGAAVTHSGQYVWNVGDIPAGGSGVITVTAQVKSGLTSGGSIVNQATIGTATPESDYANNSSSDSQTLCIPPAGASFGYTPAQPKTNQAVTFTGGVTQGDPTPTYIWDFDDGSGSGNPVAHTYTSAGDYTVWMTTTNTCGYDVYSETLSVCELPGNVAIQYAPLNPLVNQTVSFTATSTGSGVTYAWAADDGWSDSGATANHAFTTRGNHTVWLTATNSCGSSYTSTVVFVRQYGVDLQPPSGAATGKQGGTVTYTLTLLNAGNVTDTFTIAGSVTGQPWPTSWPSSVGPLAGGGTTQIDVTVQITSSSGSSRAVITATSQGDAGKQATSVLTTTATTQPLQRGVEIAPPTATQTGDIGGTVTYTLRVTNTGTVDDYFNLSISGPNWGTTLSVYGLNLKAGEGQSVETYVQIPSSAISGTQDSATVTARSAVVPSVADNSTLTTTAYAPTYGVSLTPSAAQQDGHPTDVMTYTLTVRNTGERTDTYDLSKAGNAWNTSLPASVGPLAPNSTTQFDVVVQIPAGAVGGSQDVVTVTAASQHDAAQQDSSVLTTKAITFTQPITRAVALVADTTAQEGPIGTWVTYTLRLTNTGTVADFFNLTWQGNIWPVDLSVYGLSLGAGQGADVKAYVQPSVTASDSVTDTVTVKATSASDAAATASVTLTTKARWRRVYLPLVLRNYQ